MRIASSTSSSFRRPRGSGLFIEHKCKTKKVSQTIEKEAVNTSAFNVNWLKSFSSSLNKHTQVKQRRLPELVDKLIKKSPTLSSLSIYLSPSLPLSLPLSLSPPLSPPPPPLSLSPSPSLSLSLSLPSFSTFRPFSHPQNLPRLCYSPLRMKLYILVIILHIIHHSNQQQDSLSIAYTYIMSSDCDSKESDVQFKVLRRSGLFHRSCEIVFSLSWCA